MPRTARRTRLAALLLLLISLPFDRAIADVQTYWDNDTDGFVPGGATTDRYYTTGSRINRFGAPGELPGAVEGFANRLPGFGGFDAERQFGLSIGQEIYTPDAISTSAAIANDRPYSGWLYAGGILTRRNAHVMRSLEVDLGTIGPGAQGESVQRWWHHELGIRAPQGWSHQLRNEPGLVVSYQERRRPWGYRRHLDFVPHAGLTLGNVRTEANAGGTLRIGLPLPDDFGPWRNAPAASRRYELYAFARAEGRTVAHNIHLDGNTWIPGPHVTRIPFLAETQLGVAARWRHLGMRYVFSYTTNEFKERSNGHEYGSFAIIL